MSKKTSRLLYWIAFFLRGIAFSQGALLLSTSLARKPAARFRGTPDMYPPGVFQFAQESLHLIPGKMPQHVEQVLEPCARGRIFLHVPHQQREVRLPVQALLASVGPGPADLTIEPLRQQVPDATASADALDYAQLFQRGKPGTQRSPNGLIAVEKIDDDQVFHPKLSLPGIAIPAKEADQFRALQFAAQCEPDLGAVRPGIVRERLTALDGSSEDQIRSLS